MTNVDRDPQLRQDRESVHKDLNHFLKLLSFTLRGAKLRRTRFHIHHIPSLKRLRGRSDSQVRVNVRVPKLTVKHLRLAARHIHTQLFEVSHGQRIGHYVKKHLTNAPHKSFHLNELVPRPHIHSALTNSRLRTSTRNILRHPTQILVHASKLVNVVTDDTVNVVDIPRQRRGSKLLHKPLKRLVPIHRDSVIDDRGLHGHDSVLVETVPAVQPLGNVTPPMRNHLRTSLVQLVLKRSDHFQLANMIRGVGDAVVPELNDRALHCFYVTHGKRRIQRESQHPIFHEVVEFVERYPAAIGREIVNALPVLGIETVSGCAEIRTHEFGSHRVTVIPLKFFDGNEDAATHPAG